MAITTIIVNTSSDCVDPLGHDSPETRAFVVAHILDAVRAAWPGADVREGGHGSTTSGRDADGNDISAEVAEVADRAYNDAYNHMED